MPTYILFSHICVAKNDFILLRYLPILDNKLYIWMKTYTQWMKMNPHYRWFFFCVTTLAVLKIYMLPIWLQLKNEKKGWCTVQDMHLPEDTLWNQSCEFINRAVHSDTSRSQVLLSTPWLTLQDFRTVFFFVIFDDRIFCWLQTASRR